jgi:hypothetical protein
MPYALIVAISGYEDSRFPPLCAPERDAAQLGRVPEDPSIGGFTMQVMLDENERVVRRKLYRLFRKDKRPNDLLLVHFSCHWITDAAGSSYRYSPENDLP